MVSDTLEVQLNMAQKGGLYFFREKALHIFLLFDKKFYIVRRTEVAEE